MAFRASDLYGLFGHDECVGAAHLHQNYAVFRTTASVAMDFKRGLARVGSGGVRMLDPVAGGMNLRALYRDRIIVSIVVVAERFGPAFNPNDHGERPHGPVAPK